MQEQILELFKKDNKALTVDEIFDILDLTTVDDLKSLMKILNEMEDNLLLRKTKKDKYEKHTDELERRGILLSTKGDYSFVKIIDDKIPLKDVYVHNTSLVFYI